MEVVTQHYEFINDLKLCHTKINENISELDACIKKIVKKEGYISCDVVKKTIPADGGNYLGKLYEIDIKGITADGDKETAIFVKGIESDCEVLDILSVPGVYKSELFVYTELFQIFNKLQNEANIPEEERYNTVKCYEDSYEKAIIMENLNKKGFKIAGHRMDVIDFKMAQECVKQLSKFHGLSFVLQQRNPGYFDKKIKPIKVPHIFGEPWQQFIEKFGKSGLECLDEKLRNRIENILPRILSKMEEGFTDETTYSCLCHGDYRPNNIMTKEVDGKITIVPIDYQIISYGCPVIDFLYFMYVSTDRHFRKDHMVYLKNLYYKSLENFLGYFDISVESVLPRKTFESIYEEKLDFGLAITFIIGPFLFVSENGDVPDVTKDKVKDIDFKLDDKFKDRLTDAVEEFIDWGYL